MYKMYVFLHVLILSVSTHKYLYQQEEVAGRTFAKFAPWLFPWIVKATGGLGFWALSGFMCFWFVNVLMACLKRLGLRACKDSVKTALRGSG